MIYFTLSNTSILLILMIKFLRYAVPDLPIAVAANIEGDGLNKLVNHLIEGNLFKISI